MPPSPSQKFLLVIPQPNLGGDLHRVWPPWVQTKTSPAEKHLGLGFANAKPGASLNRNDDKAKMLKNILERGEREGSPHNLIPHPDSTASFSAF